MSTHRFSSLSSQALEPIPFPLTNAQPRSSPVRSDADVLEERFEDVSRRIDVLARQLGCLGYFDDDDDRPRAA